MDIKPFLHEHYLLFDKYKDQKACCDHCNQRIVGWAFTCETCKFWLHESCAKQQLPGQIPHPLHSQHLLTLHVARSFYICDRCLSLTQGCIYSCKKCNLNLDLICASLTTPYKTPQEASERSHHRHKTIQYFSHSHRLSLFNYRKVRKDEYSCRWCEKLLSGMPYGCLRYPCSSRESIDNNFEHGSTSSLVDREVTIGKVTGQKGTEIDYFDHEHPLRFYEVIRKNESFLCKACTLEIYDQAYVCKYGCKYYLHKACTKLSHELLHPLHPQHSLKLITSRFQFTCDECRQWFDGFCYRCYACDFKLDVKCATLSVPENESQRLKEMETRSKLCPFNQHHKLNFFIYGSTLRFYPECHFCDQQLQGPSYECIYCEYKLHESCLEFPLEMQLHFHPLHSLRLIPFARKTCLVCKYLIYRKIRYSCLQCDLHVHPYCAKSQKRTVKSKSHMHNLYYFGPNAGSGFYRDKKTCDECKERFSRTPFYFCMECGIMLHIKCTVPHSVKSKYHIHPLTLKDYFKEDDSGEYYCDICEEERDPQHHSYYCAKCEAPFVAHIDCGLNSVEENAEAEEPSTNLASDFDHT
ncbi:uncharacterized protein LOC111277541 [Durio zibethinus]|uniref:Uncharacterized protein LOC111277541 n=1 Tax=Durio zibethinus TaxID=66656 RepID=A0A6P5WW25_DURZI|nr:uncharacterized protein LOC111277541 [Durio zibethinus]